MKARNKEFWMPM